MRYLRLDLNQRLRLMSVTVPTSADIPKRSYTPPEQGFFLVYGRRTIPTGRG